MSARKTPILAAWRGYVDADPELTTPAALPRTLFNDHIPEVLEAFAERLRAGLRRESVAAAGVGAPPLVMMVVGGAKDETAGDDNKEAGGG